MTPHSTIARIAGLLPTPRAELAAALGVSQATLRGWLQASRGPLAPERPGRAEPSAAVIARARVLLAEHAEAVRAMLSECTP